MRGPIVILANPVAGGGRGHRRALALQRALHALGAETDLRLTTRDRDGTALSRTLGAKDAAAIAVVGGDGSIADVVRGLTLPDVPLGVLPSGTANVWARAAGLPRDPQACARVLLDGRTVTTRLAAANGQPFFLFCGAGYDARVIERVESIRRRVGGRGGGHQWLLPALREALGAPLARLHLTVDGTRHGPFAQVLLTRVSRYASRLQLPRGFVIQDPRLHIVAVRPRSKIRLWALGARAALRPLRPGRDVEVWSSPTAVVRIESEAREPIHLDGDVRTAAPVDVGWTDRHLRLIVPAGYPLDVPAGSGHPPAPPCAPMKPTRR